MMMELDLSEGPTSYTERRWSAGTPFIVGFVANPLLNYIQQLS